ncbi:helix-turn-helix domain-containing protein, partial [Rhodoblastus sp.]|uniref:helix-turn-helix domain-containing protein n=1 Tax=Rhodoblastus sp. TaxID=1962975 RepID=UPI003F94EDDD
MTWLPRGEACRTHLREDHASIARVAAEVGYSSPSAFAHAVRRTFGYSPRSASRTQSGRHDGRQERTGLERSARGAAIKPCAVPHRRVRPISDMAGRAPRRAASLCAG